MAFVCLKATSHVHLQDAFRRYFWPSTPAANQSCDRMINPQSLRSQPTARSPEPPIGAGGRRSCSGPGGDNGDPTGLPPPSPPKGCQMAQRQGAKGSHLTGGGSRFFEARFGGSCCTPNKCTVSRNLCMKSPRLENNLFRFNRLESLAVAQVSACRHGRCSPALPKIYR